MQPQTTAQQTGRPGSDTATDTRPAPSPSLADILRMWQGQGKIDVIPLATVAADLAAGRLSPLVEET